MLFNMVNNYLAIKIFCNPLGEPFGTINRPMLSSCAAKTDRKIAKVAFQVFGYRGSHHLAGGGQELFHFGLCLQKFDDWPVFPCVGFVLRVTAGIGQGSAVENIAAAVSCRVLG